MPSVLILGISRDGDVSMAFASNFLKFQGDLQRAPHVKAAFDIVPSLEAALQKFSKQPEYEYLVAIDTNHGVDNKFLFDYDPSKDFVVGIYPDGDIDWDRVKSKLPETTEEPHLVGIRYNIDPSNATPKHRYLEVNTAGLRILKISRKVIEEVCVAAGGTEAHAPGLAHGGHYKTADERFCALWGKPIYACLDAGTSSQITVTYGPGCIAWRPVLR